MPVLMMSECSHSFKELTVQHDEMDQKQSPRSSPDGHHTKNTAEFWTEFWQHSDSPEQILFRRCGAQQWNAAAYRIRLHK
jgi:hypothetical protein